MKTKFTAYLCRLLVFILAITLIGSCVYQPSSGSRQDYWPTQEWRSASPEAQGMDSAILAQMLEHIQKQGPRLHSLLIVRNGFLVTEIYYPPYGPQIRHGVASITKSVVGTLIGMAIDQGKIQGADQKLLEFFPGREIQNLDAQKQSITLKNLLSMTPGLDCQDQTAPATGMYQAGSWVQYLLDLPVKTVPGTQWIYCSGAAHLLSAVLESASGVNARTYANQRLFAPLGIPEVSEADWSGDPQGYSNGIAGLFLTPRELAKYGYLYLNEGRWDGKQIVPAEWVRNSTREQATIGKDEYVGGLDRRFGYMWSIFPDQKYYGYLGMSGQEFYLSIRRRRSWVFTGSLPIGREGSLLSLVNDYIIPAVQADQPIKANPQAVGRLNELIQAAASSKQPVPALPQLAQGVSGKTYLLGENVLGWRDMTLVFQPEAEEAILKMSGSPDMRIGLDNVYRITPIPGSRPIALRGRWSAGGQFMLDYNLLGDSIESTGRFTFTENRLDVEILNHNYGGPPLMIQGRDEKAE